MSTLPASTETLSLYAQFLSRTFKSCSSIKNYISGVKTMHHLLGYSVDHINDFLINLGIKCIARMNPYCIKQAKPVTPEILLQFASVMDFTNSEDVVFWCLFLFAFFLFSRKSNLVPTTKEDVKNGKCLLHKDVSNYLVVSFRFSKTIQFGERILETPLVKIPGSKLCPVTAYEKMCRMIPADAEDPLFSLPNRKCVFYSKFQYKLKNLIEKIGLNPNDYSSHGFRRAGCTFAFSANVPTDLIQLQGDWHSDAYKKYLAFTMNDKLHVAEQMKEQILSTMC